MASFAEQIRDDARAFTAEMQTVSPGRQAHIYALVDCVRDDTLGAELDGRSKQVKFLALSGRNGPALVQVQPGEGTLDWLFAEGGSKRWFITVISRYDFGEVWSHARKFTQVRLHDGRQASFRYYDPAIWTVYAPAFSVDQRRALFSRFELVYAEVDGLVFRTQGVKDGRVAWTLLTEGPPPDGATEGFLTPPQIDLTGAAVRPVFALSKQQYEMPVLTNMPLLIQHLDDYVRPDFEWMMRLFPPGIVRAMLEAGATTALRDYRLNDLMCVRQFVDLQWRVAPGFHVQPQINALLRDEALTPEQKFDRLSSDAYNEPLAESFDYDDYRYWGLPFPGHYGQPAVAGPG